MRYGRYILLAVTLLGFVGLVAFLLRHTSLKPTNTYVSLVDEATLKLLPEKDASGLDTSHLATAVTPPTNKWFSGLALQAKPETVFPTPLSFTPTEQSFTFDLPKVVTNTSTIAAGARKPVTILVAGATHYVVTRYDETSVDLTYRDSSRALGTVTLVAGLPYIYYHAVADSTLNLDSAGSVADGTMTFSADGAKLAVAAYDGARIDNRTVTVPNGSLVTMYATTNETERIVSSHAMNRVESSAVTYQKEGNAYRTTIHYKTVNGQPTCYGELPHQQNGSKGPTFATIYGSLVLKEGMELSFTTPEVPLAESLDLSKLNDDERKLLAQTVRQDANTLPAMPDDSYFGGKSLYREAQLLILAKQLGENEAATALESQLKDGLAQWLKPGVNGARSLYFDTRIQGVVGVTPSFGSDAFNDHHFHFGYFIYAASVLARFDSTFKSSYAPVVNLLVADIANYRPDEKLPLRRVFDPYFGHSWASGSAPFADGNNQESSSEAINAWVGTELWAKQTDNAALADEAGWMLSNETVAASAYWLNYDEKTPPYSAGYDHTVISLNWGGKRDYATFFSAEPKAMLGIQLIPMNPTMQYLAQYGSRIGEQLKEAGTSNISAQFDDYLLMYGALSGEQTGLERAKQLPDAVIDGANSRSYMYAWIMSR